MVIKNAINLPSKSFHAFDLADACHYLRICSKSIYGKHAGIWILKIFNVNENLTLLQYLPKNQINMCLKFPVSGCKKFLVVI